MKILHTSDWHIGRTFHGHSTVDALRSVLAAMVEVVRRHAVDVVVVPGDVFDSAVPAAEHFTALTDTLVALRAAGASVVITSGNHDSAARLGFQSGFLGASGVHVITRPEQYLEPVLISDEHGDVAFYGIPYLEPTLFRHRHPEHDLRRHDDVLAFVMDAVRADITSRGVRSVVLSHCFVVGVRATDASPSADDAAPRDITAGGLDYVSLDRFDGPDYVALGHIHGRAELSPTVRYSGSPLHYSFGEAGKPRGAWLVDMGEDGVESTEWVELPVPRRLSIVTGTLDEILVDPSLTEYEGDWVSAVLTDTLRPHDAMVRLQRRFPWCATLEHRRPASSQPTTGYTSRVSGRSDVEIVAGFLEHVRDGVGPTASELTIIGDAFAAIDAEAAV